MKLLALDTKLSIREKINIAIGLQAVLIVIISIFIFFSFKAVLSKLHFIEAFDDLNISFLEMRKSEKNYFLYHDPNALKEAYYKGQSAYKTLLNSKQRFISKLGKHNYQTLVSLLNQYLLEIKKIQHQKASPLQLQQLGHQLTKFSTTLIKQEHYKINRLIHQNTIMLLISLGIILISQLFLWQYFFRFLSKKLLRMEALTKAVAKGHFHEVAIKHIEPEDEIGFVINAITRMAQELEKREEQLLQAKKLASLGVLISGVAHELGNPLNNISMLAEGYLGYYDSLSDAEKKDFVKQIQQQAERIRKIVKNLLDFSRQKTPELKECDPVQVIEQSVALVANQMRISNIKLHKSFAPDLPHIYIDPDQIQQVLVNLFINAIHAMPKGGDLFVEVKTTEAKDKVIIKVRDTGVGIKPEILPHIFDPFFTTKGTKGTGLGLSVSYGIIKQHNGKISVSTEVGKGTTFTIELPAYSAKQKTSEEEGHA